MRMQIPFTYVHIILIPSSHPHIFFEKFIKYRDRTSSNTCERIETQRKYYYCFVNYILTGLRYNNFFLTIKRKLFY